MTIPAWHEEPIAKAHDRKAFDCGDADLNDFLRRYARQSHEQGGAKTFLAIDNNDPTKILGFYSIAPAALGYERLPGKIRRGLARHDVPGYRLARIATHIDLQGRGLGGQLLAAAARRCILAAAEVGGVVEVTARSVAFCTLSRTNSELWPFVRQSNVLRPVTGASGNIDLE